MLKTLVRFAVRWIVVALAVFGAVNVGLRHLGAYDVYARWVRVIGFPACLSEVAVVGLAVGLLLGRYAAWLARGSALLLALLSAVDVVAYYRLLADGAITSRFPIPAAAIVAAVLVVWALVEVPPSERKTETGSASRRAVPVLARLAVLASVTLALVLLHLFCFGATDYRRPADAAVVFGARVHHDGEPSGVLRDRVHTACDLYDARLVQRLILSGGHGDDAPISEPQCMRKIALERGVPEGALILDETGVDTRSTIRTLESIAAEHGLCSFLMVSTDYHLSRIQLTSRRRGFEVYTVPAVETCGWPSKPLAVLREGAAWLWYYVRGLEVPGPTRTAEIP